MVKSRSRIYPLLTEVQIQQRVRELGAQITEDYAGKDLVVIGLLNGVYPFFADLTRAIDLDLDVNFMRVASYGGGLESTGEVKIIFDVDKSIRGRHTLVIEDIVDTGRSMALLKRHLLARRAASVKICALVDKTGRREVDVQADYVGFRLDDGFLVGCGLDYAEDSRGLPGIYEMRVDGR